MKVRPVPRIAQPVYPGQVHVEALLEPLARRVAGHRVQRLLGFWMVWNALGGDAGMVAQGWAGSGVWRSRQEFLDAFGVEVADFLPELAALMTTAVVPDEGRGQA